ncbi:MAG TPA: rRNA adenine N-6-methyltransferase family protein, partial [Anaerolineales bacterium]|nr:rRNA adenine N-6-methyltransferase family protein [Anaerolineales bacterium]
QAVVRLIDKNDVVLDIGAGDLRLAVRLARIAKKVYALERQVDLLRLGRTLQKENWPANIILLPGDARRLVFPTDVTTGVLLMRHCRHFRLYAEKLKAVGAERLITNARWGLDVESIALAGGRGRYTDLPLGWFACLCGQTGFKPGPVEQLNEEYLNKIWEVHNCPACENS